MEYINLKNTDKNTEGLPLFMDEKDDIGLKENCHWLTKGDFIALYETEKEKKEY